VSAVRRRGALRTRITVDEAATVKLSAGSGRTTLAAAKVKFAKAGARAVSLKLTAAGRRLARRKALTVSLTASAKDAAGNTATAKAARTLRR